MGSQISLALIERALMKYYRLYVCVSTLYIHLQRNGIITTTANNIKYINVNLIISEAKYKNEGSISQLNENDEICNVVNLWLSFIL